MAERPIYKKINCFDILQVQNFSKHYMIRLSMAVVLSSSQ